MVKEQMRIVIAEVCGIKLINFYCGYCKSETHLTCECERNLVYQKPTVENCFPNYPEDLNACHEMEKVLTNDQWTNYLGFIIGNRIISRLTKKEEFIKVCNATTLQRCEAFIKTVCPERWVD